VSATAFSGHRQSLNDNAGARPPPSCLSQTPGRLEIITGSVISVNARTRDLSASVFPRAFIHRVALRQRFRGNESAFPISPAGSGRGGERAAAAAAAAGWGGESQLTGLGAGGRRSRSSITELMIEVSRSRSARRKGARPRTARPLFPPSPRPPSLTHSFPAIFLRPQFCIGH